MLLSVFRHVYNIKRELVATTNSSLKRSKIWLHQYIKNTYHNPIVLLPWKYLLAFCPYNIISFSYLKNEGGDKMGMPKIEATHIDEACALTALLQSIALEEAALAHILNAEGEKIQKAVCIANCAEELLAINESTALTVERIAGLENALRDKTIAVLNEINDIRNRCMKC